mmetsp:Transcript_38681/g.97220  ORF Transcript_38681/g.97220 Transcript_38681/m.97220 type:complete len:287 (-) Transcript_38681:2199-3059(-)
MKSAQPPADGPALLRASPEARLRQGGPTQRTSDEAAPPHMRVPFEERWLFFGLPKFVADNCGSKPCAGLDLTTLCNVPKEEDFGISGRAGMPRPGVAARRNSPREVSPKPKSMAIAEAVGFDLVFGVAGTMSGPKDFACAAGRRTVVSLSLSEAMWWNSAPPSASNALVKLDCRFRGLDFGTSSISSSRSMRKAVMDSFNRGRKGPAGELPRKRVTLEFRCNSFNCPNLAGDFGVGSGSASSLDNKLILDSGLEARSLITLRFVRGTVFGEDPRGEDESSNKGAGL